MLDTSDIDLLSSCRRRRAGAREDNLGDEQRERASQQRAAALPNSKAAPAALHRAAVRLALTPVVWAAGVGGEDQRELAFLPRQPPAFPT